MTDAIADAMGFSEGESVAELVGRTGSKTVVSA
jgi:hypothetical protein